MDERLQQLREINERDITGKFKSQRGGSDEVVVKYKVNWPHNQVLSGNTKNRPTYDSLSVFQWVAGFGRNVQHEPDPQKRQIMLDYMCDSMEDAQNFSWTSAKAYPYPPLM